MYLNLIIWFISIVFSLALGTFLCYKIEKSGIKRWGASGNIFKYTVNSKGDE